MNYSTRMSEYYLANDLYVGAQVDFNSHKFVLIDADEYAFRYMEGHAPEVSLRKVLYTFDITDSMKKKESFSMNLAVMTIFFFHHANQCLVP